MQKTGMVVMTGSEPVRDSEIEKRIAMLAGGELLLLKWDAHGPAGIA